MSGTWSPPLHPRDRKGRFTSSGVSKSSNGNKAFLAAFGKNKKMAPIKSGADADNYVATHAATDLTPAQTASVTAYLDDPATTAKVNASLRAKTPNPDAAADTKNLTDALRPLDDDLVLNRTVSAKAFGESLEDLPGMTVHDAAFTSTSLGVSTAGPGDVQVKIAAPKGTPAIIAGDLGGNPEDREVLLAPGQELAVVSVTPNATGGHTMAAVALPASGGTSGSGPSSELDQLKAEADKLGPNSKAAADYKTLLGAVQAQADKMGPNSKAAAALAAHSPGKADAPAAPSTPAAPSAPSAPAKGSGVSLAQLGAKLPAKQQAAPSPKPAADVPAAPKVAAKPVKTKPATVPATYQRSSLDGLTGPQLAALKLYSGDDYVGINGGLRRGEVKAKYKPAVAGIDEALASKPLPAPAKVWRTVSGDAFGLTAGGDPSMLKGKVFTEPGFMSTSTKNQRFGVKPPPVHFTFEVPAGVGAAYIDSISKNPGENELLLPRNLQYVVSNVRYNSAKGGWTATARILPPVE